MRSGAPRESGLSTSHTNGGEGNETTPGEPPARFARARGRPRLRRGARIRGYGHAGVAGPRDRWTRDDGRDLLGGFWARVLIHCWRNLDRDAVGNSTYTLSVTTGSSTGTNSSGGSCLIANGTGSVIAANGDTVTYSTVGTLCQQDGPTSRPVHYNGTYYVTLGTGRFSNAVGTGNAVATAVSGTVNLIQIDGSINY